MEKSFNNRLLDKCNQLNNRLCIGLDIDPDKLPDNISDLKSASINDISFINILLK